MTKQPPFHGAAEFGARAGGVGKGAGGVGRRSFLTDLVGGAASDADECGDGRTDSAPTQSTGLILPDYVPRMEDDNEWGHRGRGSPVGYLKGLVHATA